MKQFTVKIRNKSDDKLYNVNIFNDKRINITFIGENGQKMTDEEFSNMLTRTVFDVGAISIMAYMDYPKFVSKQVNCVIADSLQSFLFTVDAYQYQSNVSTIRFQDKYLLGVNPSLILNFLMPEMEMNINFIMKQVEPVIKKAEEK